MSLHLLASNPKRVLVRDHDRFVVSEALLECIGDRGEHPRADRNASCIGSLLQGRLDSLVVHPPPLFLMPLRRFVLRPESPRPPTGLGCQNAADRSLLPAAGVPPAMWRPV